VRDLKDLVRTRTIWVRLRGEEVQRLDKVLESAAVKMSTKISDIMGVSGRRMLDALVAGERDPDVLAGLAHPRVKASAADLSEALTGRFDDHHAFLVKAHLDLIDYYTTLVEQLDVRIEACFTPDDDTPDPDRQAKADLAAARDLLTTIPGILTTTAEKVLAEIGPDMSVFPTAKHLTSWAGVAPGANESAGKVRSTRCRPGNTYLKGALGTAALAASRTKNTFLAARYKRVRSRRGHSRALVAVQRSILVAIWTVLSTGQPYTDLGGDYYTRRRPGRAIANAVAQLRAAGMDVTFTSTNEVVVT
jgi:transposase